MSPTKSVCRCVSRTQQSMACNWYSVHVFVEWVNKWNSDLAHPYCLIPLCWLVPIHMPPADLHSMQSKKSSGNQQPPFPLRNDKREQKLKLEKWGQTLLSHSQQRFSQHAVAFSLFGKLAIFYRLSGRDATERIDQDLGRGPCWIAGYDISWRLVSPSSGSPCQVVFEVGTSSPRADAPTSAWEADSLVPRGCLPTPSQGFVGRRARESWTLKGKRPAA